MTGFYVRDNTLSKEQQDTIKQIVTDHRFPWYFQGITAYGKNTKNQRPQFCNYLYFPETSCTPEAIHSGRTGESC